MVRGTTKRLTAAAMLLSILAISGTLSAQPADGNTVLGPGLYVFQTRIDHATCGDADRTGEVTSYYAAVDGIPYAREMRMTLINSRFWPVWTLTVTPSNVVIGDGQQAEVTGPNRGTSHFEVTYANGRFTGRGQREYGRVVDGNAVRCRVSYEALLLRIDR